MAVAVFPVVKSIRGSVQVRLSACVPMYARRRAWLTVFAAALRYPSIVPDLTVLHCNVLPSARSTAQHAKRLLASQYCLMKSKVASPILKVRQNLA